MSASREKKQRQGSVSSERALQAQQQQAAYKRKAVTYTVIGVVVAVLVAALLIWNSGFFQARTTAATVGDTELTAAELSYYYYDVRYQYISYMSYLGGYDSSIPDDEQIFNAEDNTTLRDYFLETALASAQQDMALYNEALNNGHTEADIKDSLDAQIDSIKTEASTHGYSYAAYLRAMYGPYMSAGVYQKMATRALLANLASNEKGTELYDGYSQDELDAYYQENADTLDTIEFSYLRFSIPSVETKDEDGNELNEDEVQKLKDEAKDNAKKDAEAALAAVEGGSSFTSQAEKYELTSSADHSKVVGTSSVTSAVTSTVSEQLLELGKDECLLVETDSNYYVVSFHDRYLEDAPTRDVRHILAAAEYTTDEDSKLVAPTDEAWAAAKAKMDDIQAAWDASDKTEDVFAALANENSDDGDGTTGGLYEGVYEGWAVPEFNDWVFGTTHQPGDVGLVQHIADEGSTRGYYGYHLIYYVGENEPVWMSSARNSMATTARNEWVETLIANYPTALANGASHLGT